MTTKARNSSGEDYICKYDWQKTFVQSGAHGVVLGKSGGYSTAFFEAFPNDPKCFVRGEGTTIEEAEKDCWQKYQKIRVCKHEMERRDRRDGYGYCRHCSYSAMVFESLNKCCKCKKPTNYNVDYKDRYYCKKHSKNMPKNPNPEPIALFSRRELKHRIPRKYKKLLKKCMLNLFKISTPNFKSKINCRVSMLNDITLSSENRRVVLLFKEQRRKFIKKHNNK